MIRTTITLPDVLVKELLSYTNAKKTAEAIVIAVQDWLRIKKIQKIKALQGKLAISNNLQGLRNKEIVKISKIAKKQKLKKSQKS